jgi:hypothetical protein
MTRSQKVLLGVLILVTALFAVAVGTSGRAGTGDADSGRTGLVALLDKWMPGGTDVARSDFSAPDCPPDATGRLTVKPRCVLTVAGHDGGTRRLKIKPQQPLTITAPVSGRTDTAKNHLDAGAEATIVLDKTGGTITLDCDDSPCTAVLSGVK